MPGSATTPSRKRSRDAERLHVAFHFNHSVGAQKVIFEAQWPAYACPDRRFASDLTDVDARLGVDMTRYVFIVRDFHSVFLAGLPAHGQFYSGANNVAKVDAVKLYRGGPVARKHLELARDASGAVPATAATNPMHCSKLQVPGYGP